MAVYSLCCFSDCVLFKLREISVGGTKHQAAVVRWGRESNYLYSIRFLKPGNESAYYFYFLSRQHPVFFINRAIGDEVELLRVHFLSASRGLAYS